MGRHINIKHQNQTAFVNLQNLSDQKIALGSYMLGFRLGYGLGYGLGYRLGYGLGHDLGYGLGHDLGYGLGYGLR